MMISVRPATANDIEEIRVVSESATADLRNIYRPNQKALALKATFANALHQLVATAGGRVVGATHYYLDGDRIRLIGLMVRADHRQCGVARMLVNSVAGIARHLGVQVVAARTVKETGNVPIFERLGFRVEAERIDEYSVSDQFPSLTEVDLAMFLK